MVTQRKKKLNDDELVLAIINKQLEKFNVTIDDIKDQPDWFQQFVLSEKEYQEWFDWSVDFIIKNTKKSWLRTKKVAKREMEWIGLNYGLKIDDRKFKKQLLIEKNKNKAVQNL